ncbi:MAG: pyridoxal phosphate-dependent aminotransferase [Proteobacteria bacterium]|nr:pyridoxal phosphate-dependent aminotransferase [Pseudomonadota bacterium]MDA1331260.1 pyridoxal phosphate-dependent aminotransferase [Pseudomonadota bacterium]
MPVISQRSSQLGTENAFVVLAEVGDLQRQGKDIVSFCIGMPDFPTPQNVQDAGIRAIQGGKHGYTPSAGIPEIRQAVAQYLNNTRGLDYQADDVVVAAGAKPFIMYSILATTDYGQEHEVIYPNPGFPIYESQIKVNGSIPVPLHLRESRGFNFDPAELEARINDKTRLLILNSPQNPTGGIISRAELAVIADILDKYPNVWVFSDEIYSQLCFEESFTSIASFPNMTERTIVADGCSKTWAMTGWRLGFAANKVLAPTFTKWVTNTESCASHITQWAGVEALNGDQSGAAMMRSKFLERRDLIVGLLNKVPGVTCLIPGGAFYVWPNVTEACDMIGVKNSQELRQRLLHEAGVAVLADIHFGRRVPDDGQHIRFSYAASNENIIEGVARLDAFVRKNMR